MGPKPFADEAMLRAFNVARLTRFLLLVEETSRGTSRECSELARRAAITAYCDCYESGAGAEAQRLMDRFLDTEPFGRKGWARGRRRRRTV